MVSITGICNVNVITMDHMILLQQDGEWIDIRKTKADVV